MKPKRKIVIHSGEDNSDLKDGIEALSIHSIGRLLKQRCFWLCFGFLPNSFSKEEEFFEPSLIYFRHSISLSKASTISIKRVSNSVSFRLRRQTRP